MHRISTERKGLQPFPTIEGGEVMDEIYFEPILGAKGTVIGREREGKKITGACSGRESGLCPCLLAGWLAR